MQSVPCSNPVVLRVKRPKSCTYCKLKRFVFFFFFHTVNKDYIATHLNFWIAGISQNKMLAIIKLANVILSGFGILHLGSVHGTS